MVLPHDRDRLLAIVSTGQVEIVLSLGTVDVYRARRGSRVRTGRGRGRRGAATRRENRISGGRSGRRSAGSPLAARSATRGTRRARLGSWGGGTACAGHAPHAGRAASLSRAPCADAASRGGCPTGRGPTSQGPTRVRGSGSGHTASRVRCATRSWRPTRVHVATAGPGLPARRAAKADSVSLA